jgi:hypothetical protein
MTLDRLKIKAMREAESRGRRSLAERRLLWWWVRVQEGWPILEGMIEPGMARVVDLEDRPRGHEVNDPCAEDVYLILHHGPGRAQTRVETSKRKKRWAASILDSNIEPCLMTRDGEGSLLLLKVECVLDDDVVLSVKGIEVVEVRQAGRRTNHLGGRTGERGAAAERLVCPPATL